MQKVYENDFLHPINTAREKFCLALQNPVLEHVYKFDVPDLKLWRVL